MADQTTVVTGAETPEAFLADRQAFWHSWTHFVIGTTIGVVILLILMAIFLV
ncbi:MAG: hypothetical protein J0H14_05265 [Alphaproteobacteria bacterium]|jgi:hypothetical protein|nr:hypothetical protein [Alphaproteobacteria bacterium]